MAACTSCSATSSDRPSEKRSVITEAPPELVDGHLVQPGHLPELALQRRGDGGRHHVRAGAGVQRRDLDGRVVDLGQRRQRQQPVGQQAGQQDRQHQQRGGDRALDEEARRVHGECAAASAVGQFDTVAPDFVSSSRCCWNQARRSSGLMAFSFAATSGDTRSIQRGRSPPATSAAEAAPEAAPLAAPLAARPACRARRAERSRQRAASDRRRSPPPWRPRAAGRCRRSPPRRRLADAPSTAIQLASTAPGLTTRVLTVLSALTT